MGKRERHKAILEFVQRERIPNQEALRGRLLGAGIDVAQATLSRDVRELGLVKRAGLDGRQHYHPHHPPGADFHHAPALQRLLPDLLVRAEGTANLLLLRTLIGGAQPVAAAIDAEGWPEVLGTLAGDDTILVILRSAEALEVVRARFEEIARGSR